MEKEIIEVNKNCNDVILKKNKEKNFSGHSF